MQFKITIFYAALSKFSPYRSDEPSASNMDISTGHMVLAYMEDHLKNKQRLEQEWVALCGYEAEPCATTVAFKVSVLLLLRLLTIFPTFKFLTF